MTLANSKFAIIPSCFDAFKIFFWKSCEFCYSLLDGTNVTYLTSQNKFLEDLRFPYLQANMVSVRKNYHFKNQCPEKISGYGPVNWIL